VVALAKQPSWFALIFQLFAGVSGPSARERHSGQPEPVVAAILTLGYSTFSTAAVRVGKPEPANRVGRLSRTVVH
jgi:hypothetical protein